MEHPIFPTWMTQHRGRRSALVFARENRRCPAFADTDRHVPLDKHALQKQRMKKSLTHTLPQVSVPASTAKQGGTNLDTTRRRDDETIVPAARLGSSEHFRESWHLNPGFSSHTHTHTLSLSLFSSLLFPSRLVLSGQQ